MSTSPVPSSVPSPADPLPSATGTVAGPSSEQPAFGPLEDPPRVEATEIIGEPADDDSEAGRPSEPETAPLEEQDPNDLRGDPLQTRDAVSIPPEDQPGFVLPRVLMERADHIGQETASISVEITEIERANEAAEPVAPTESVEASADKKESK